MRPQDSHAAGRRQERARGDLASALAAFDGADPVRPEEIVGRWRGGGLPTGHPLDGMLERLGWWGKAFAGPEDADPLLFSTLRGRVVPLDPALVPLRLVVAAPRLVGSRLGRLAVAAAPRFAEARGPKARLRMVEHRGIVSTAMIYDALPIVDHFRAIAPGQLIGLMDMRDDPRPFFFVLERAG